MLAVTENRPGENIRSARNKRIVPGGRPPKSDKGAADDRLSIALRREEKQQFKADAEAAGMSLTDWVLKHLRAAGAKRQTTHRRPKKKS